MIESRKCQHEQMRGQCEKCYILHLEKTVSERFDEIQGLRNQVEHYRGIIVVNESAYRAIIDRLQDRIDAIHAAHKKALCQVVKRVLKRYTQASLKVARRVAEAIPKKFKGV